MGVKVTVLRYVNRLVSRRLGVDVPREINVLFLEDVAPSRADLLDRAAVEVLDEKDPRISLDPLVAGVEGGEPAFLRPGAGIKACSGSVSADPEPLRTAFSGPGSHQLGSHAESVRAAEAATITSVVFSEIIMSLLV